jgi:hypothetical protein
MLRFMASQALQKSIPCHEEIIKVATRKSRRHGASTVGHSQRAGLGSVRAENSQQKVLNILVADAQVRMCAQAIINSAEPGEHDMYDLYCRRSGYCTHGNTVPPVSELPPPHPSWSPENQEKQCIPYKQPFLDLDPEASTATPWPYMNAKALSSYV